jgi:hypothetical protein
METICVAFVVFICGTCKRSSTMYNVVVAIEITTGVVKVEFRCLLSSSNAAQSAIDVALWQRSVPPQTLAELE